MRLALAVVITFAISGLVCIDVRRKRSDACLSCLKVAWFDGRPLVSESGFALLFATQEEADRYARDFGARSGGSDRP